MGDPQPDRPRPRPWFRFPFGARDSRTISLANCLDYGSVRWTVDTLGWKGTSGGRSVSTVTNRVLNTLQPGSIVLMHVGSHPTDRSTLDADALPGLIKRVKERGYRFVDLRRLPLTAPRDDGGTAHGSCVGIVCSNS